MRSLMRYTASTLLMLSIFLIVLNIREQFVRAQAGLLFNSSPMSGLDALELSAIGFFGRIDDLSFINHVALLIASVLVWQAVESKFRLMDMPIRLRLDFTLAWVLLTILAIGVYLVQIGRPNGHGSGFGTFYAANQPLPLKHLEVIDGLVQIFVIQLAYIPLLVGWATISDIQRRDQHSEADREAYQLILNIFPFGAACAAIYYTAVVAILPRIITMNGASLVNRRVVVTDIVLMVAWYLPYMTLSAYACCRKPECFTVKVHKVWRVFWLGLGWKQGDAGA